MNKTGSCLCGAVTFEIKNAPETVGACHCDFCRKWSGGVYIAYHCMAHQATIVGADNLTIFRSSEWTERAFCKTCGSSAYARIVAPGPHQGELYFGFGLLDDPGDITLSEEIFVDKKPLGYAFVNETETMTAEQFYAMFAAPE